MNDDVGKARGILLGGSNAVMMSGIKRLSPTPTCLLAVDGRRSITPPPSTPEARLQQDSLLLRHLPLEIRLRIWEDVLGGLTIHIRTNDLAHT